MKRYGAFPPLVGQKRRLGDWAEGPGTEFMDLPHRSPATCKVSKEVDSSLEH